MSVLRLVAENPFRVLGVYANSPKKEIVANKGKATAFLKVGKSVEYPLDLNGTLPPLDRTIEMFNEAEAHLAIAKEQIQYAQFWFLKMTPLDDIAFNHLIAGDMATAKEIWSKQENLSSLQNKMVCYLIEGYTEYALTEAEKLYERFGDEYIGKIDAHSTLQMTGTELLHQLIDLLGAEVGMQSLWECELEGETRDYIGRQTVEPLINKISAEIDKAHNVDRQNANARLNAAKKLSAATNEPLTKLKGILGGNDPQYQIIADKLGLEILQCGIDYYNNSEDDDAPHTAMKIQTYAQLIVVGNLAKQRCNENVKILQKIINDLPPQSVLAEDRAIKVALEKYNNQPDEISYALTLLNTTKPNLQIIRERLGVRNVYYLKMSTLVVRAALHNVVEEVNNIQEQVAKRASIGLADDDDILEVTKTVYKGWNAITVMDEFHLEDDFQSHYNKNRSSLKSMCDQLGLSSFTTPSRSTTTSSTNSRTTSRPTSSYVNSGTSSRPSSYSTNSRTSYSGSSSSSSYNKKTNTSSEDKYLVASVVIVEIIWLIIGIANDDRYNPWWQNFLIGGVGLWLFPINYIPMAIINWLLTKLLDDLKNNNMNKFLLPLLCAVSIATYATPSDSLKLETLQRTVTSDSVKIANLQKEVTNLKSAITRLKQEDAKLQIQNQKQATDFDSLKAAQNQQDANVNSLATKLDADLLSANKKIDENVGSLSDSLNSRTWFGVGSIFLAIMLLAVVYFILRKKINKGSSSISKIKAAQESLESAQKAMQEESVKLDSKLVELLDKQVANQPKESAGNQPDHSLALKVADEIVRIETNLSHMDESVKGYKQLKKAVERIRDNFMANGYEIVEMLGKPYNEGMKVVANFVSDDTLADGEQKITGITKPQVNYNGKMIQSAQITVSQN